MDAEALLGRSLGNYLLQQVIGSGTMGVVYRAVQSQPLRNVAVKVITRAASLDIQYQIEFLDKFRGALARVAMLEHPHIVPIYAHGDIDGLAYVVMADIQGETLEDILARTGRGEAGALDLTRAMRYLGQIAGALDYAHEQGIIHRDIKPANIFITDDDRAVVADFHLTSLIVEGTFATLRLSRPGMLDYMSPELVIGKAVDARADIYSLGAMLFHMVTGSPLFQGQTLMKVATKHLKMPPPSPRALRPDLSSAAEQAILKALEKKPEDRYEYARDLALVFRQALQESPPAAIPAQPWPAPTRPFTRRALSAGQVALASESPLTGNSTDALSFGREKGTQAGQLQSPGPITNPPVALDEHKRATTGPVNRQPQPTAITGEIGQAGRLHQATQQQALLTRELPPVALAAGAQENTGMTGTLKLTSPARLVSIPVAGQPGQYITGILPKQPLQEIGRETALPR
jgi:serine/threonine protein kinase